MKKIAYLLALAGTAFSVCAASQTVDPKTELATRVVALQQGPELDRLVQQLSSGATQELIASWGPKLESTVPKAKQKKASDDLNIELKKYSEDASQLIGKQVGKVSADTLIPAYAEKFSLEELKQIADFFESPAIKKYQSTAPELGNVFVQKLIEASRPEVLARAKEFEEIAGKIVGSAPAPAPTGKAPVKK